MLHLGFLAFRRRRQHHDAEHRGLTRSVMPLMVPPLPAASRPSNTMQIFAPVAFTSPGASSSCSGSALEFLGHHGRPGPVVDWPVFGDLGGAPSSRSCACLASSPRSP